MMNCIFDMRGSHGSTLQADKQRLFAGRNFRLKVSALLIFFWMVLSVFFPQALWALPEEMRYQGTVCTGSDSGNLDDHFFTQAGVSQTGQGFSIGFEFKYYGNAYTHFIPTSNGVVTLVDSGISNSTSRAYSNTALPSGTFTGKPSIMAFWDDIYIYADRDNALIQYATIGSSPNRQCIIQFNNIGFYGASYLLGTFSVILFEDSNEIQLQYRNLVDISNTRAGGNSATIGLDSGATSACQYSLNTAGAVQSEKAILFTPDSSVNPASYTHDDTVLYAGLLLETDVGTPRPTIPTLISPAQASTVSTQPTFQWSKPDNVVSYTFNITATSNWSTVYSTEIADPDQLIITPSQMSDSAKTGLGCDAEGNLPLSREYYWAVFANNASGSTWSEIHKITTSDNPPLTATPQVLWAVIDNDATITLQATGGAGAYTASITSLPAYGLIYQYNDGIRGGQISTVPVTVSDSQNRVIYWNGSDTGTNLGNFDFEIQDANNDTNTASVTVHISAAAPPQLDEIIATDEGEKLLLRFTKAMADPTGKQNEFTITVNGIARAATSAAVATFDDSAILLTLASTVAAGDSLQVIYDAATGSIESSDGGLLDDLDNSFTVANVLEPTAFTVTAVGANQIDLAWDDNSANETGFEIHRATAVTGPYFPVYTTAANGEDYYDTGLTANTVYYYKIRAVNATNLSEFSTEKGARTFISDLTITANALTGGSIDPVGVTAVLLGRDRAYTIAADDGYHVADLLVDGVSQGSGDSYTFSYVQDNHTILARFEQTADNYDITVSTAGNGTVSPDGIVAVDDSADQTFTFTADIGCHVADVIVDGVSQGPSAGYTFSQVKGNHSLHVEFVADAASYVIIATSSGYGSIDPAGAISVNAGDGQPFTATPDANYHVATLKVDGEYVTPSENFTFSNVLTGHTVHVTFEADSTTHTITANGGSGGSITPEGIITIDDGATQAFTITPDADYHIADLLVDGVSTGPLSAYAFTTIITNHTITATFAEDAVEYTITASAGIGGSISPSGVQSVTSGGNKSFAITPDANYHIADLLVDGVSTGPLSTYAFTTIITNHTITATFAEDAVDYTITASAGIGGSISPSGVQTVSSGDDQSFTITPAANYHIEDLLVDGVFAGPLSAYVFTAVVTNHTITATFAEDAVDYTITASAGIGGSISPSGVQTVPSGDDQSFILTPDANYQIQDLIVDGTSAGAIAYYTFSGVAANHTIQGTFAPPGDITSVSPDNGPLTGGNTVTIIGIGLGSGSDITAVSIKDVAAAIVSQSATQVVVTAGDGTGHAGIGDVVVTSTSSGVTTEADAYTYVMDPTVSTTAISLITLSSATAGGNVTADGGGAVTGRGVCWSTSENPITADSHTSDGTGTGEFTSSLTGLSPGTTYHVRAYAINAAGIAYGNDITFTTSVPESVETVADGNWNASSTWQYSFIPTDVQDVTISHDVTLDASGNAKNLSIAVSKTLSFSGTNQLAIAGDASITGTMNVADGICNTTGTTAVSGELEIGTGTYTANGSFDATGGTISFGGEGTLSLKGMGQTCGSVSLGTLSTDHGTVDYAGTGDQQVVSCTYHNLTATGGAEGASVIKTLCGAITVTGDLIIANAYTTLDVSVNHHPINIAGNWTNSGIFSAREGAVTFTGDSDSTVAPGGVPFYELVLNKTDGAITTRLSPSADLTVAHALTITRGTFDLDTGDVNLRIGGHLSIGTDGRWTKSSESARTVTFSGTDCTITDSDPVQNLGYVKMTDDE